MEVVEIRHIATAFLRHYQKTTKSVAGGVFEQRRREEETRGHVPSEIATLKNVFVEQYGICDIRSNFQHTFGGFWGL